MTTARSATITLSSRIRRTLRAMVSPIVLTTVTTVAGFLFSTATNISSIQSFGIFMAVGLVSAQIISLLLIPAWINLMGGTKVVASTNGEVDTGWLGRGLAAVFAKLIRNRKSAMAVFAVVMVAAGVMATRISVEDAGSAYFLPDNEYRKSDEFINAHIAGTSPGWVRIEGAGPNAMLNVDTMAFIDRLDAFLLSQPKVTYTYSPATYVKRMNLAVNDMKPGYNRLPNKTETVNSTDADGKPTSEQVDGDLLVSQLIMLYENGGGNDLTNVLTRDFSNGTILFTMNTTRATEYQDLLAKVDAWLAVNKPANVKVSVAGTPVVWSGVLNEIIKGQLTSFILAFSSICMVLMLWMRSAKLGVLTALPLAATMIVYYGMMAALGIELNIGTALISFIVVGIVDYSVHFLHRVQVQLEAGSRMDNALIYAILHSGRSIAFNVAVFSLGFLTLLFSEFMPIAYLGGLVALALAISGFMSLFLISMLAPWFMEEKPQVAAKTAEPLAA